MELKQVLLLLLVSYAAYAVSLNNILDQINSYVASPFSFFLPAEDSDPSNGDSTSCPPRKPILRPEFFPCCVCGQCGCGPTTCPEIVVFPPQARWPINSSTPVEVAAAGCGANYTVEACLHFVQLYLHALQPALERASNNSREHLSEQGGKKKKVPCCGDGCSDAQCLSYLAVTVKNLQAPVNGTLDSVQKKIVTEPASVHDGAEGEKAKSEL